MGKGMSDGNDTENFSDHRQEKRRGNGVEKKGNPSIIRRCLRYNRRQGEQKKRGGETLHNTQATFKGGREVKWPQGELTEVLLKQEERDVDSQSAPHFVSLMNRSRGVVEIM